MKISDLKWPLIFGGQIAGGTAVAGAMGGWPFALVMASMLIAVLWLALYGARLNPRNMRGEE